MVYHEVGDTAFMSKFATSNLKPNRDTKPDSLLLLLLLLLLPLLLLLLLLLILPTLEAPNQPPLLVGTLRSLLVAADLAESTGPKIELNPPPNDLLCSHIVIIKDCVLYV